MYNLKLSRVIDECKKDRQGTQYSGKIANTLNGHECLHWMQYDIDHDNFHGSDINESINYCRKPK